MRVKCLAQEYNTMSPARARTRTARSGDERNNHEANITMNNIFMSLLVLESRNVKRTGTDEITIPPSGNVLQVL